MIARINAARQMALLVTRSVVVMAQLGVRQSCLARERCQGRAGALPVVFEPLGRIPPARLTGGPPEPFVSPELTDGYCRQHCTGFDPVSSLTQTSANDADSNRLLESAGLSKGRISSAIHQKLN